MCSQALLLLSSQTSYVWPDLARCPQIDATTVLLKHKGAACLQEFHVNGTTEFFIQLLEAGWIREIIQNQSAIGNTDISTGSFQFDSFFFFWLISNLFGRFHLDNTGIGSCSMHLRPALIWADFLTPVMVIDLHLI